MIRDTLLIRHLPSNLSDDQKFDLLNRFGAVQIKCLSGKFKKSNVVFARFESDVAANIALNRLHQLNVLGYPLLVEFAHGQDATILTSCENDPLIQPSLIAKEEKEYSQKYCEAFLQKLNSWNAPLNFLQPPPPNLNYLYPPPSQTVLTNISIALASVPKFYTQVLHLMNKMNLPLPFETNFQSQDISLDTIHAVPSDKQSENEGVRMVEEATTEEESEIESDPESCKLTDVIPTKRVKPQIKTAIKKRKFIKLETFLTPSKPITKPEKVFDMICPDTIQRKNIELKISGEGVNRLDSGMQIEKAGGFGLMFPPLPSSIEKNKLSDEVDSKTEDTITGSTITSEQLAANRIPSRDQKHLPVFKNYQPGIPSCRLYIKNLSKQVEERDLHFIYRKYLISDHEEQGSMFDIRLMKEGRMKGQAFVTLQNTNLAQHALVETNGYILKDKPLVVQFARSSKIK